MTERGRIGAFEEATGGSVEEGLSQYQKRYRRYQFELIAGHCGETVLEVGAGLGDFASQFHGLRRHVLTDVDPDCVAVMRRRFADNPEVETLQLDLAGRLPAVEGAVSTVVAINVLEHITDDSAALSSLARLVQPGGRIVLWVPGYMQLYGDFDRRVGHVRRYTPETLEMAIVRAGLVPGDIRPVNMLGAVAWWIAIRRGGVGTPKPGLLKVYDRVVVPITRALERRITPPFGQSVLAVARVPER